MQLLSVVWYCCVTLQGDGAQCLQRQMVTQPPRELWPCPSMVVQLCTLDRTAVYSATAFAGGIGSSLIYFYFYLILGYARHPFVLVQGIHHFYNGKQRPAPSHSNTRFELRHSCESCHLVLQGQDSKPVEAASPPALFLLQYRSQPMWDILQTCTMPAFPHIQCAASGDQLGFSHGWNYQSSVLFLHSRIQRISNNSAKSVF